MRILWITETYPPARGGMAQSCDRIVRGLRAAGVRVDVAHLTRRALPWRVQSEDGGLLLTAPLEDDPEHALRRLWTAVDRDYTHVVAFGGTYPLLAGPTFAAWLGVPLVTLLRGNDFDTGIFSVRRKEVLLSALRSSTRVCVVARSHQPLVSALAPGIEVTWVANGIDVTNWEILPSELAAAQAWRDSVGRRTLGVVGHLKRKKGIGLMLEALQAAGQDLHVLLVGELEEAVTEWLVNQEIAYTLMPFLDRFELPGIYARCDLVALPSFYDGLPNVALEAAALGIPLVASDAGGLADLVDDDIGFSFRAGDPHSCRAALDRAGRATDAELAKLGQAAADRVRRDFGVAAETAGYLAVFGS
jgi:glycosyltransferase involved in cell wall biosynthesis